MKRALMIFFSGKLSESRVPVLLLSPEQEQKAKQKEEEDEEEFYLRALAHL